MKQFIDCVLAELITSDREPDSCPMEQAQILPVVLHHSEVFLILTF